MTAVSGQYLKANGRPDKGTVTFQLIPSAMDSSQDQRTDTVITCPLDHTGSFTVDLVPDDQLLGLTSDAVYLVTEKVGDLQRAWHLVVPDDTPINLHNAYPGSANAWDGAITPVPGQGVPPGGTTGQVLGKNSGTNYDTAWIDQTGGEGGGVSDHGGLTGLNDDDHTQYALADGSRGSFEVVNARADHETAYDHGAFVDDVASPVVGRYYSRYNGGGSTIWSDISGGFYTQSQMNSLLLGKAPASHSHDKADITDFAHTHPESQISDLGTYPDASDGTNGQIAQTNGSTWSFIDTPTGGGASAIDDLSDVDTSTAAPTTGQALVWDGSQWEPGTVGGGASLPAAANWIWAVDADYTATIDPTGVSDSTAGLQEFLDAIPNNGVGVIPGGVYRLTGTLDINTGTDITVMAYGAKFQIYFDTQWAPVVSAQSWGDGSWGTSYTVTLGTEELVTGFSRSTETSWVVNATLSGSPGYQVGDIVRLWASDVLPIPSGSVAAGQYFTVASSSGTAVQLAGRKRWPFTTSVRLAKMPGGRFTWMGGTFNADSSVMPPTGTADNPGAVFYLNGTKYSTIRDVRIRQGAGAGFQTRKTYRATIDNCSVDSLPDVSTPDRVGYGVIDSGEYTLVRGLTAHRVRHAYTNDSGPVGSSTNPTDHGTVYGSLISEGFANGTTQAAWDTHGSGHHVTFQNCKAYYCYTGFQLRGWENAIVGGYVRDASTTAVSISDGDATGGAYGNFIGGGLVIDHCQDGYPVYLWNSGTADARPNYVDGVTVINHDTGSPIRAYGGTLRVGAFSAFQSDGTAVTNATVAGSGVVQAMPSLVFP